MPVLAKVDVTIATPDQVELPGILDEVFKYWCKLKHDRWAPRWDEFELEHISNDAIPYTIIVDVIPDPLDFRYRFWGTANTANIGYDCTGKSVRENEMFSDKVFNECKQIYEERRPLVYFTKAIKPSGLHREYMRIRLPMTKDNVTVSHILSVMHISENLSKLYESDSD